MSNLSNQYISSSYQSVLNLEGIGSGLTVNTQVVTDGWGQSSPLKLSTTTVEINGTLNMSGSIIPAVSNSVDLGSPSKPFRHIYAGSGSLYLDGNRVVGLDTSGANTTLQAPNYGSLYLLNDIIFDAATGSAVGGGGRFTMKGNGDNNSTDTHYSGSYHFVNTNGIVRHSNALAGTYDEGAGFVWDVRNGGLWNVFTEDASAAISTNNGTLSFQSSGHTDAGYEGDIVINSVSTGGTANSFYHNGQIINTANQITNIGNFLALSTGSIQLQATGSGAFLNLFAYDSASFVIDTPSVNVSTAYGQYVPFQILGQYGFIQNLVHSHDEVNGIYAGHTIDDLDDNNNNIGFYGVYADGATSGSYGVVFNGGGMTNNHANDGAIWRSYGNKGTVEFLKNVEVTGSFSVQSGYAVKTDIIEGNTNQYNYLSLNGNGIYGQPGVELSSSTGNISLWAEGGNVNVTGSLNVTNGTLNINAAYPGINLKSNLDNSGSAYNISTAYVDVKTDPTNVFSAFSVVNDSDTTNSIGISLNSYTGYYTGATGVLYGGQYYNGSDAAIGLPESRIELLKPTVSKYGFAQEGLISAQTIPTGEDTVITFNNSDMDPSGWYNGEYFYYQPTVAGTYQVSYAVNFVDPSSGTGQVNVQIRKNGSSRTLNQNNLNVGYNVTLTGTYFVDMNGTTDTLDLTAYSSVGQTVSQNGTYFNIKLI